MAKSLSEKSRERLKQNRSAYRQDKLYPYGSQDEDALFYERGRNDRMRENHKEETVKRRGRDLAGYAAEARRQKEPEAARKKAQQDAYLSEQRAKKKAQGPDFREQSWQKTLLEAYRKNRK